MNGKRSVKVIKGLSYKYSLRPVLEIRPSKVYFSYAACVALSQ